MGRGLRPRSDADLIAGLVFIAFGAAFGVAALDYDLGSLRAMGPGYAPLALGLLLVGLGAGIVVKAYVAPDKSVPGELPPEDPGAPGLHFERVHPRPILFITAATLFFAGTVEGLGLMPATLGTALIATLAAKGISVVRAVAVAAGLTAGAYVIFVVLLQLRIPLLGDWLG